MQPDSAQNRVQTAQVKIISISKKLSRIGSGTPRLWLDSAQNEVRTARINSKLILSARNFPESVPGYPECSRSLLRIKSGTPQSMPESAPGEAESCPGNQNPFSINFKRPKTVPKWFLVVRIYSESTRTIWKQY